MKKISNLLFYLLLIYLIINPIWNLFYKLNMLFCISFLSLDILLLIVKIKNKMMRFDFCFWLFIMVPLGYILNVIFNTNIGSIADNIVYIFSETSLILTVLLLRGSLNKNKINSILITLMCASTMYFFISFIYQIMPKNMMLLNIFSYFGDTYINSIDRFYGTFNYCNASALFFVVSIFIAFFKISKSRNNKVIYIFALYINMLGFLFTFSKMVTMDFLFILLVLIVYLFWRKKKERLRVLLIYGSAIILPTFFMISFYRQFLINLNLLIFILEVFLIFGFYLLILKIYFFCYDKFKVLIYILLIFKIILFMCFMINPVNSSLIIKDVSIKNDYIISDFILEEDRKYKINIDVSIRDKSDVSFLLCRLYVKELIPVTEVIMEVKEDEKIEFNFNTKPDTEYYFIKIKNLNKKTNIKINSVKINDSPYLVNSLIVPYQYVHQLQLLKYDKESVSHRFLYYKDSFKIIRDSKFLIGHGYNTFYYFNKKYKFNYLETDPHSYLFQLWLDVGIIGLFYIFYIYILGIKNMWKKRKYDNAIIWFCIFSLMIFILPFDCIFSIDYFKLLLMLSFIILNDMKVRKAKLLA